MLLPIKRRQTRSAFAAVVVVVMTGGLSAAPAHASPARVAQGKPSPEQALALAERLGNRSAGAYQDGNGDMVVTVTDQQAAREVQQTGAIAKTVGRGARDLKAVTDMLARDFTIPGTAWYADPETAQVVVMADSTVTDKDLSRLNDLTRRVPSATRIRRQPGRIEDTAASGDKIVSKSKVVCSLGFNVKLRSGEGGFLTAGHCADGGNSYWFQDGSPLPIGGVIDKRFPGDDWAVVRYLKDIPRPGAVNLYNGTLRDIDGPGTAWKGRDVAKSGARSFVTRGKVTGVGVTVNPNTDETVYDLIMTDVCAVNGDSGGALFSGSKAIGIVKGGENTNGRCVTFAQPVNKVIEQTGVQIY